MDLAWGTPVAAICVVLLRGILLRPLVAVFVVSNYANAAPTQKALFPFGLPKCYAIL